MNKCKFGLCDGSGEVRRFVQYVGGEALERSPCECTKRDAAPVLPKPPEMTCSFWGCEGCPACIPGYVP